MSLLVANGSRETVGWRRSLVCSLDGRRVISTRAETLRGRTLRRRKERQVQQAAECLMGGDVTYLGLFLMTEPSARSTMAISLEKTAGRLAEWWKSSKRLPEVIGMSMSKRMTWAVKDVTCGTSADCGHRIEPML